MKHKRKGGNEMKKHMLILPVFLVAVVAIILGVAVPESWAFEETLMRWEVNATDQDAGVQIFLDGEGWSFVDVFDPNEVLFFSAEVHGDLLELGGTEFFLETDEPHYQNLGKLQQLLETVEHGEYEFVGQTVDGDDLSGEAELTRTIPAGPVIVSPVGPGNQCAADVDPNNAVIDWDPVTTDIFGSGGIVIVGYQVIVENEDTGNVFDITLPALTTSITVPPEFLEYDTEYKFEVLAKEESENQTITERCFVTMEQPEI